MLESETLQYADDDLLIFLDESGDHRLNHPENPTFLFAGVAVSGKRMAEVSDAWLRMKRLAFRQLTGKPLHARRHFTSTLTTPKREAVLEVLSSDALMLLALAIHAGAEIEQNRVLEHSLFPLQLRLEDVANKMLAQGLWSGLGAVHVVFESSTEMQHATIQNVLGGRTIMAGNRIIEIDGYFMAKGEGSALLQAADIVAHIVGRNMRVNRGGDPLLHTPDFNRLFAARGRERVAYMQVSSITINQNAT